MCECAVPGGERAGFGAAQVPCGPPAVEAGEGHRPAGAPQDRLDVVNECAAKRPHQRGLCGADVQVTRESHAVPAVAAPVSEAGALRVGCPRASSAGCPTVAVWGRVPGVGRSAWSLVVRIFGGVNRRVDDSGERARVGSRVLRRSCSPTRAAPSGGTAAAAGVAADGCTRAPEAARSSLGEACHHRPLAAIRSGATVTTVTRIATRCKTCHSKGGCPAG